MFRPFGVPDIHAIHQSKSNPVPESVKRDIKAVVKASRSRSKKYIVMVNKYFVDRTSDSDLFRLLKLEDESLIEMAVI